MGKITEVKQVTRGVWAGQWEVRLNREQYGVWPTQELANQKADELEQQNAGGRLWN
jgi:hypothetical protein